MLHNRCPLLFLDIDGVLVTQRFLQSARGNRVFCPTAFGHLRRVVDVSGCEIVISSTWRIGGSIDGFRSTFERDGWPDAPVVGLTPDCPGRPRGEEIALWLEQHDRTDVVYVILDDDADFLPGQPLVRTDYRIGLTEIDVRKCLSIFGFDAADPAGPIAFRSGCTGT